MALTDRQAADLRKEDAVSKAYQTVARHKQADRASPATAFRNGLIAAVDELRKDLIVVYAELGGAGEEPLRSELARTIGDRVTAFIRSSVAGVRGQNSPAAAREGVRLISSSTMGIARDLDLAVHEQRKRAGVVSALPTAPVRRKQDKFEILDSPKHYEADFPRSIGMLGVAVIYFDLDDFKALNTRFTETVIDRTMLPELQRLIAGLVQDRGYAYAEGGDEFIIMLPNTNSALAEGFASLLLERIRSTSFIVGTDSVNVTASAGIASSLHDQDVQACRDAASHAKRDAKQQGKDRYVVSAMRT